MTEVTIEEVLAALSTYETAITAGNAYVAS